MWICLCVCVRVYSSYTSIHCNAEPHTMFFFPLFCSFCPLLVFFCSFLSFSASFFLLFDFSSSVRFSLLFVFVLFCSSYFPSVRFFPLLLVKKKSVRFFLFYSFLSSASFSPSFFFSSVRIFLLLSVFPLLLVFFFRTFFPSSVRFFPLFSSPSVRFLLF